MSTAQAAAPRVGVVMGSRSDWETLKPASDTPLSAYHLVKVCQEAGIPRGVVNLVTGSGTSVGSPLMQNSGVDLVSFTGTTHDGTHT